MNDRFDNPLDHEAEDVEMPYRPDAATEMPARGGHVAALLDIDGVEGTAFGQDNAGHDAVLVYVRDKQSAERVPRTVDSLPVEIVITGEITAE